MSIWFAAPEASAGNQSIMRQIATPITEATIPSASMRATGCFSPSIRGSVSGGPSVVPAAGSLSLTARESYWTEAAAGGGQAASERGVPAQLRRRPAVVAAEGLRELRRLAVPDRPGNRADRQRVVAQELGGAGHAHALQLPPEARAALAEDALELAPRGGDGVRHGAERQGLVGVVALDRGEGLVEQLAASVQGRLAHSDVLRSMCAIGCVSRRRRSVI